MNAGFEELDRDGVIRVLLVEDEPGDAELVRYGLRFAPVGHFEVRWEDRLAAVPGVVEEGGVDVVLLDLTLPDSSGLETVQAARHWLGGTPIIVLTGHDDDEFALKALEAGAQDYLVKGEIEARALVRAIRYAISRARLEQRLQEMATTDPLTGLANRRRFLEAMALEYARLRRDPGHAAGLLMLDIDHFKRFNDRYGHDIGDAVLVEFARSLQEGVRASDLVGRLGGEEFAVLLPDTDGEQAVQTAEKLRRRVAAMVLPQGDGEEVAGVTTSIGVTGLDPADGGAEAAFKRADTALYRAKHAGRDRVEQDEPDRGGA